MEEGKSDARSPCLLRIWVVWYSKRSGLDHKGVFNQYKSLLLIVQSTTKFFEHSQTRSSYIALYTDRRVELS